MPDRTRAEAVFNRLTRGASALGTRQTLASLHLPMTGDLAQRRLDGSPLRTYVLVMAHPSGLTEERLTSLYEAEGFGGEKTMRAKVIRELIDEIRVLRSELLQAEADQDGPPTGRDDRGRLQLGSNPSGLHLPGHRGRGPLGVDIDDKAWTFDLLQRT